VGHAVSGRVLDCVTGTPIPGAKVDIWLTASDGEYAVQRDNVSPRNLCGIFHTAADGAFSFKCIRPTEYKVRPAPK
jgi:catechol 1,2-dioxygenase